MIEEVDKTSSAKTVCLKKKNLIFLLTNERFFAKIVYKRCKDYTFNRLMAKLVSA